MIRRNEMVRNILTVVLIFVMLFSVGCSKNKSAEDIATQFLVDVMDDRAYRLEHKYIEDKETIEVLRDTAGNVKTTWIYEDNTKEEFYCVSGEYSAYVNGELMTECDVELVKEIVDTCLEEAEFYVSDTLEVFDVDIDSDIVDVKEDNLYMALGEYEDGTSYYYSYGKDGTFFNSIDDYEEIRIDFDENISVELPQ